MKCIRNMKLFAILLATMIASSTFVACGDSNEEQDEWYSPDDDENNNNSDPTYEIVKKNISTSVSYGD